MDLLILHSHLMTVFMYAFWISKRETISETWLPYLDTLLLLFSSNMSLNCRCEELAGPC